MSDTPCLNRACQWHNQKGHTCKLFPGRGRYDCRHRFEKTTKTNNTKGAK